MSEERHILGIIVDNEPGVLGRVVGLFSGRGYNINSLTVSEVDRVNKLSRITITTTGSEDKIAHIMTLIERLIPVHKVKNISLDSSYVERGLALVKVKATENRDEISHIASNFGATEVDATKTSFVFEITDITSKINEFIEVMSGYGIIDISRTGISAISRGNESI